MRKVLIFLFLIFHAETVLSQNENTDNEKISDEKIDALVEERLNKILKKISTAKISEFSKSLLAKEKQLEIEAQQVEIRKLEITKMEKEVLKKVDEISKRQRKIIGCIDKNQKKRENRIDHLVQVVSGMKPQIAADMLAVQDSTLTVEIISKLDPTKVSKIFNLMDKEISARLQKEYLNMQQ